MKPLIIAIDGPSGAGKSTLGRLLARALGLLYVDTGAMYRAVAYAVLKSNVDLTNTASIIEIAQRTRIELAGDPDSLRVVVDNREVSDELRTEAISHAASIVSTIPEVRAELVRRQREMGERGNIVLDGRDIGTIVFPQAGAKFFLTAAPEIRAERRYEEHRPQTRDLLFEEVLRDINTRDERDSTRHDSPLAIADDAVVIDSTEASVEEVLERMLVIVRTRFGSDGQPHD